MIFHLYDYLRSEIPGIPFYAQQLDVADPQDHVLIMSQSGSDTPWPLRRVDYPVQFQIRHKVPMQAHDWAYQVYAQVREWFGKVLPAPGGTGGGFAAPINQASVTIISALATQPPVTTGRDEQGRTVYVFNVNFVYQDNVSILNA